jgi:hypothetical protein
MRFAKLFFAFAMLGLFACRANADNFPTELDVTAVGGCVTYPTFLKFNCIPMSLNLEITVQPFGFADWLQVKGVTGMMDGVFPIVSGTGAGLEPEQNYVPGFGGGADAPVYFQALGDTWIINLDQIDPAVYVLDQKTGNGAWISWDVTPINEPEPSSLALLTLGLAFLLKYRSRNLRRNWRV